MEWGCLKYGVVRNEIDWNEGLRNDLLRKATVRTEVVGAGLTRSVHKPLPKASSLSRRVYVQQGRDKRTIFIPFTSVFFSSSLAQLSDLACK